MTSFKSQAILASNDAPVAASIVVPFTDQLLPPVITGLSSARSFTVIAGNILTNDTNPTLTIAAAAGATVEIFKGGVSAGFATETAPGIFSITSLGLGDGTFIFTAIATTPLNPSGVTSAPLILTVDATAPGAPAINAITNGVTQVTGTVANGGFTNDATPTLTGTAEANSTVMIFDGATPLGTATADGTGAWTFTTVALPEGGHSFTATATDAAGNIGPPSAAYGMIIDITAPVVTVGLANDTGSSSSDTLTSDDTLTGSASANAVVTLTEGANTLGTASADGTGHWTFTPSGLANGSHTIVATETDAAGNTGSASLSFVLDTANPSVVVNIVDASFSDNNNSSDVTFAFSEKVSDATVANLASGAGITVVGGVLSALAWDVGHTQATATFTATDSSTTAASVTVNANSYTDVAGNLGSSGTDTAPVDTANPSVIVNIVDASFSDNNNSSDVTFAFSEKVSDATVANLASGAGITVVGGVLSALVWDVGHTQATATFTATDSSTTAASVTVNANSYTDVAGNLGSSGTDTAPVDTANPSVIVNIVDASFSDNNNSSDVTFAFSEKVSDATVANLASGAGITVVGGVLSALVWDVGHTQATATFTATDGSTTAASVTVNANSYTDVAGNLGSSGTDTAPVDTANPSVIVNIVDASFSDNNNSSDVTFAFSEKVSDATVANLASGAGITVVGGVLSALVWDVGHTQATTTFTATDGSTTAASVTVNANSYTDVAGNLGSSGTDTAPVDTANPSVIVNIVDASFSDNNNSSDVTFAFSEKVSDATVANLASGAGITVVGGVLSALVWDVGHTQATATFTATDSSTTAASVTVNANSYTDVAGNLGSSGTDTAPVDTANPSVIVNIVDASFSDNNNSSDVTFAFSEKVSDATVANLASGAGITVVGGVLSALAWDVGHTQATATFTATDSSTTAASVTVNANSYTDVAGNLGSSGTDTAPVDTANPSVIVNIVDASFSDNNNSSDVTFAFSEKVSDATVANLASGAGITVVGGVLSALVWDVGHTQATATFTATDSSTTAASVTVNANSYTDVAGNLGSSGTDTAPVDTANPSVIVNIVDASFSDNNNSSDVTFAFSEKVSDATVANLASGAGITVVGGVLSALAWDVGHTQATATFTATDGSTTAASVTVNANSYTDVAGNLGSSGTDTAPVDTANPSVIVNIVDASFSDNNNSSDVTFAFSEKVSDATVANLASGAGITVVGGVLSALVWDVGHTQATATFTATDSSTTAASVTVNANSYTDVAGNLGSSGTDTAPVDTANPSVIVNIVDGSLNIVNNSSTVTFVFSEAPGSSFTASDIVVSAGLTLNSGSFTSTDSTHFQATVTAVSGFNGTGTVTLAAGSYIDAAGNAGGPNSDTVPIDMRTNDPNDFDDQATGTSITTVGLVIHGTANDDNPINAFNSGQTIYGGAGNDTINGDNSGDILFGGSGDDHIFGNNGGDTIYGGSGKDTIDAGLAVDLIIGGYGADTLTGSGGGDTFKFLSVIDSPSGQTSGQNNYDTISDFNSGLDLLDFSAISSSTGLLGIQGSTTASGTIAAHSIAWVVNGSVTDVYVNTSGSSELVSAGPDMQIHLQNVTSLNSAHDFVV